MAGAIATIAVATGMAAACPQEGSETVVVRGVEPGLELRLEDGRVLRLVGVEPAGPTPGDVDLADAGRRQLADMIAGRDVRVAVLAGKPDRWGRLPAYVFAPGLLNEAVLSAGLGRYRPEPAAHGCRDLLVGAEAAARAAPKGLWRDAYYAVLDPGDGSAFAERSASIIVAEGRLTAVEAGPYRTRLRLAARAGHERDALTASILPRNRKAFAEQGVAFPALVGRSVRVRGLLDLRYGPQIELASPDALEVLPLPESPPEAPLNAPVAPSLAGRG